MGLTLFFSTFVSEDLTCIAAGILVARGALSSAEAVAACALGIWSGDLCLWLLGRAVGKRVLTSPRVVRLLPGGALERFATWFDARAGRVILASRFSPGARLPLYVAAGAARTSFAPYAAWTAIAVALWTPAIVSGGVLVGDRLAEWLAVSRAVIAGATIAAFVHGSAGCVNTSSCAVRGAAEEAARA
jgi:membrane protein DedA with SNARE-associated domain